MTKGNTVSFWIFPFSINYYVIFLVYLFLILNLEYRPSVLYIYIYIYIKPSVDFLVIIDVLYTLNLFIKIHAQKIKAYIYRMYVV